MTCWRSGLPAACLSLLCWRRAALAALRVLISSLNSGGMVAEFSWTCKKEKRIFELRTSKKDNEMHDRMISANPQVATQFVRVITARG